MLPAMAAMSLFVAAPALAKTTIQKGQRLCREAAEAVQPSFRSVRIVDDETRASNDVLVYSVRVVTVDGAAAKITCIVDRQTDAVTLEQLGASQPKVAAPPSVDGPPLALAPALPGGAIDYAAQVQHYATLPQDEREAKFGALRQEATNAESRGDYAAATAILDALAGGGDAASQVSLARLYRDGRGVTQDLSASVKLLTAAAGQGLSDAQVELGDALSSGAATPVDLAAAQDWYRKAAAQGDVSASAKLEALTSRLAETQPKAAPAPSPQPGPMADAATPAGPQSSDPSSPLTAIGLLALGGLATWYWLATRVFIPTVKCPRCRSKMTPVSRNREHSSTFQKRLPSVVHTIEAGTDHWTYVCNSCKTSTSRSRRYKEVIDRNSVS